MATEKLKRRTVLTNFLIWIASFSFIGALAGPFWGRIRPKQRLWQIDPDKCVNCGHCQTHCVLAQSAVRCVHTYAICGYCDLCSGYFRQGSAVLDTAAERQLCPTGAIERTYIEDPYFEYKINRELCVGCGRCAKACAAFGNGSLYLQIQQDLCIHCHQCSIAAVCPSDAIGLVSSDSPYLLKGD